MSQYTPEDPKDREKSGRETRRLFYRAPELMFRPHRYTYEIDMWSIGCIVAEMVLCEPLFWASSELELLLKIFSLTGSPTENLIRSYVQSGSEIEQPMIAFPKWKVRTFKELCSGRPEILQEFEK